MAVKYLSQIDLEIPPTNPNHVVRLRDMKSYVEFSEGVKEFVYTIEGDGVSEEFIIEHGFDTLNIMHEIYDATTLETFIPGIIRIDSNTVKVSFGSPVKTDEILKVILLGVKT